MKVYTFLFIIFIVSFISDIILNDLSSHFNMISSLKSYFQDQSILLCGLYAAITIEVALFFTMIFFYLLFRVVIPNNNTQLLYFCGLAFVIGYVMDVLIEKNKIFGNRLDPYYTEFGSGILGSLSFIFAILISYFIQKNVLPIL